MKRAAPLLISALMLSFAGSPLILGNSQIDPLVSQARQDRDSADAKSLDAVIAEARAQASSHKGSTDYVRLALLEEWRCEVAYDQHHNSAVKQAAQAGINAAQTAVNLDPSSVDAHWLLGDLLGQLIPYVTMGGMRYGPRGTREIEKALALDPKNTAYVARASFYYYTPAMFGGDKAKAVTVLQKAIELDPASDAADTAHIRLAQIYKSEGKHDDALREVSAALKLNPKRRWAQMLHSAIVSGK